VDAPLLQLGGHLAVCELLIASTVLHTHRPPGTHDNHHAVVDFAACGSWRHFGRLDGRTLGDAKLAGCRRCRHAVGGMDCLFKASSEKSQDLARRSERLNAHRVLHFGYRGQKGLGVTVLRLGINAQGITLLNHLSFVHDQQSV